MSQTIEARQKNPEESEKMANLETPDNDLYGYLSRKVADAFGEYLTLTIGAEGDATLTPQKETKNFGVYETSGGAVVGMGISKDVLAEAFDYDPSDEDAQVPQEVGLSIEASTEDDYEQAEAVDEDEVEALLAGADSSDSSESEEEDEAQEVEISDEELALTDD